MGTLVPGMRDCRVGDVCGGLADNKDADAGGASSGSVAAVLARLADVGEVGPMAV